MTALAKLPSLEDRLRALLRSDQLAALDADECAAVALTLRRAADELDRLGKLSRRPEVRVRTLAYEAGAYMGERAPLAPQLRAAADRLEVTT